MVSLAPLGEDSAPPHISPHLTLTFQQGLQDGHVHVLLTSPPEHSEQLPPPDDVLNLQQAFSSLRFPHLFQGHLQNQAPDTELEPRQEIPRLPTWPGPPPHPHAAGAVKMKMMKTVMKMKMREDQTWCFEWPLG